jgi:hypothetical protein
MVPTGLLTFSAAAAFPAGKRATAETLTEAAIATARMNLAIMEIPRMCDVNSAGYCRHSIAAPFRFLGSPTP